MARIEPAHRFARLRVAVLDRVRLVEHDEVQRDLGELVAIASDDRIRRDHHVVLARDLRNEWDGDTAVVMVKPLTT